MTRCQLRDPVLGWAGYFSREAICVWIKNTVLEVRYSGFKSWVWYSWARWSYTSYLTFLCLNFFICIMRIVTKPISQGLWSLSLMMHIRYFYWQLTKCPQTFPTIKPQETWNLRCLPLRKSCYWLRKKVCSLGKWLREHKTQSPKAGIPEFQLDL